MLVPAPLTVAWRTPVAQTHPQLLVMRDQSVAIAGGANGVSAYASSDGHLLWHSASLQAPLAFSGDRLIAKSPSGALVAIQARTGVVVWTSTQTFGDAPAIAADDTMVVVSTKNGNVDGVTPFFGLNAATGALLWRNTTDTGIGDGIDVYPGSIVVSYSAGEPHFSYVDIHDPRDGRRLAQIQAVPHMQSYFKGTLWLSDSLMAWDGGPDSPALDVLRYDATTAKRLPDYVYRSLPLQPHERFSLQFATPIPVVLTSDAVYFQNGARLYRYDRGSPPENQHPVGTALPGQLAGVIGDNAAILSDASRLTVAVRTAGGYVQHDYDLSAQMPKTTFAFKGHVFAQGGVVMLASDSQIAYANAVAGAPGSLLAILKTGQVFVADQKACSDPEAVALLREDDAIAVCSGALVRVAAQAGR